jgi:hypothetical protein
VFDPSPQRPARPHQGRGYLIKDSKRPMMRRQRRAPCARGNLDLAEMIVPRGGVPQRARHRVNAHELRLTMAATTEWPNTDLMIGIGAGLSPDSLALQPGV